MFVLAKTRGRWPALLLILSFALSGCDQVKQMVADLTDSKEGDPGAEEATSEAEEEAEAALAEASRAAEEAQAALQEEPAAGDPTNDDAAEEESGAGAEEQEQGEQEQGEGGGEEAESATGDPEAGDQPAGDQPAGDQQAQTAASDPAPTSEETAESNQDDREEAPPGTTEEPNDVVDLDPVEAPSGRGSDSRTGCGSAPDPNQCTIDRLEGRARHAYQMIELIDAYLAKARYQNALPLMETFVARYPTHGRARRYRRYLAQQSARRSKRR